MEEQVKAPIMKGSLIYGIILGLATIVVNLVLYFIDQSLETWVRVFNPIFNVGMLILMVVLFKKEYGNGTLYYGKALS